MSLPSRSIYRSKWKLTVWVSLYQRRGETRRTRKLRVRIRKHFENAYVEKIRKKSGWSGYVLISPACLVLIIICLPILNKFYFPSFTVMTWLLARGALGPGAHHKELLFPTTPLDNGLPLTVPRYLRPRHRLPVGLPRQRLCSRRV